MKGSGDFSIGSPVWPGTSKLIEEMGELHQVLGKLIAVHGDAEIHWSGNLLEKLVEEIGDVLAAAVFFRKKNMTVDEGIAIDKRFAFKLALFEKWHVEQPTDSRPAPLSLLDRQICQAAMEAGCNPVWSDGIVGWAWHCACEDGRHGIDQQCSAMTLVSIARANKNPDPAVGDEP